MYVFLLAGSEVVMSALVLAICNFLFIKKKPKASEAPVEAGETEANNQSSNSPTHKSNGNSEKTKDSVDLRPENVTVDPSEEETFLKEKDEQNIACVPETDP